jgi:aminopeptidase N
MLLDQLARDEDCMGRIEAAQELAKIPDSEVIQALGKAVAQDRFWGVQAEVAKSLAEIRNDESQKQLIAALDALSPPQHSKARRAVVNALGTFQDEKSAQALRKFAEKDESYFVEADSTHAWATAKLKPTQPSLSSQVEEVERFLNQQMSKPSYRELIRASSLSAMGELPGIGRGESSQTLATLIDWTARGKPLDARSAAVRALGKVLKTANSSIRSKIMGVLTDLSDEDNFRLRMQMVAALEESGCPEAISILSKVRQLDTDGRVKRGAQVAIDHLLTAGTLPESVEQLKRALEKLEEDQRKLRSRFEERGHLS